MIRIKAQIKDIRAFFFTQLEKLLELNRTDAESVVAGGLEPLTGKKLTLTELQKTKWFCSDASAASVDTLIMMGVNVMGRSSVTTENTILLKYTDHNEVEKFETDEQMNGSVLFFELGVLEIERKGYEFYWC